MEVDVIVIGSGAAGLTTAVVAANEGLKVLVVEKAEHYGGTTAFSGGASWIIANHHQPALGIEDDPSAGETYLRSVLGNLYDPSKVATYIASGAEMVSYMEANTQVRWQGIPGPDYLPEHEGHRFGRTLLMKPFNGRSLGNYLKQIRKPLKGFAAFGSMQVDMLEGDRFKRAFKDLNSLIFVTGRLINYGIDLLRFGRGAYLANGNALIGRLLRTALDSDVKLWRSASAVELIKEGGAVRGVIVEREGRQETIHANRAVVLASGGFGANKELTKQYIPNPDSHVSVQPAENVGDGIRIGQEIGGKLGDVNPENGVWAPVSVLHCKDGSLAKFPDFGPQRGKPGSIIVDENGRRFFNEAAPYQQFVGAMNELDINKAYFIGSRRFLREYGMGVALPAPYPLGSLIRDGYLIEGKTLAELAGRIGIPPSTLEQTVADFNTHAVNGEDPVFHRGVNAYDPSQGDLAHLPNPNVGPVGEGPYYALTLFPGNVSTVLGLATDTNGQVLDEGGNLISGLFAVGLDQNTVFRGKYPGGGSSIGPAMTFGYRAARKIAEEPL